MSRLRQLPARIQYHVRLAAMRAVATAAPNEFGPEFTRIYARCAPFTMTTVERMFALHDAVNHVHHAGIPGDVVECGVWRGGSSMLAAHTLLARGDRDRKLRLFDTFTGMPEPGPEDSPENHAEWLAHQQAGDGWALASLEDVRANMLSTGLGTDRFTLHEGRVEDTIPDRAPETISVLRLDTDFYASTLHELVHLYPRLAPGGILIIDDYGAFVGARKAVDKYFAEPGERPFLARIDHDSRIAIKPRT